MRYRIVFVIAFNVFLFSIGLIQPVFGQVTAGNIPVGTSIVNPDIEFSIVEDEHDTTAYLDIDCDVFADIHLWFFRGYPPADGPNFIAAYLVNHSYSICIDTGNLGRAVLYDLGDSLCIDGFQWSQDSLVFLSCYGGWTCTGDTSSIHNKYIAYKKNATQETGWIKISMSLYSSVEPDTITFSISEMLVLCLQNGIKEAEDNSFFSLMPNPTYDGSVIVRSTEKLSGITIYNSEGQIVKSFSGNSNDILLPETKGIYFVYVRSAFGNLSCRKVLRL